MTFTYVESLGADKDKVRFWIGDTTPDGGAKPGDENFSDEELNGLIAIEGSWQRAVAGACEALALLWNEPDIRIGPRSEALSQKTKRYAEQATAWRKLHGYSSGSVGGVGSASVTRVDGYSSDISASEV